jgi:glycyl-tRNA synthetase beta subunit
MSFGSNGVDWVRSLRKFNCRFFVPKVAKTALLGEFRTIVPSKTRNSENATNMSFGSNGVDWVRSLRKIQLQDFLFQKSLKRTSRASFAPLFVENRNSENARNMSFGSNGVDWVRSLRKIQLQDFLFQKSLKRPSGRVCAVVPSKTETPKTATNMSFGSNGVDWVRSLRKIQLQDFLFQKSL